MICEGQMDIFDWAEETERASRPLRNGLMLDVTDPHKITEYAEDWQTLYQWPEFQHFYGFQHPCWNSPVTTNKHEYAVFITDLRCHHTLPGGFGGEGKPPNPCSCVGDWYERAYCATCGWWSKIVTREIEAKALGKQHALGLPTDKPMQLPFTVATGPNKYAADFCAYCGTKKNLNEGGAGPAGFEEPSYDYNICDPCSSLYRQMRPPAEFWTFKEIQ